MAIRFTLEGAEELARTLGRSPRLISEEERRAMTASLLLVERDARRGVRQDTRQLMNSITSTPPRQEGDRLVGQVGPSARYGYWVEFGRKARRRPPPTAALRGWARRHTVPERALFLVARAIGRRGIKARPFMAPAWFGNVRRIEALFAAAGARITARLAGDGGRAL